MEPLSIGILIVTILLIIEVVVMLIKLRVDKMLLLIPIIGVIFAVISFALNEYRDKLLSSLSGLASSVVIQVILAVGVIFGLFGVAVWFRGEKEAGRVISGVGNNKIPARNMKCPNCGAEVRKEDKFCGECGKPLLREIDPKWKWGSMIASLVLILFFWSWCVDGIYFRREAEELLILLIILLIFGFPATIYFMYKERTKKIKYGLAWILFPILILLFCLGWYPLLHALVEFLLFAIPAIVIDIIYVYKTR